MALPINRDGSAGHGRVHVEHLFLDDFAFDMKGNLYGASIDVVRVTPDGASEILLTSADGLDTPTSVAFDVKKDNKNLYVANGAFPYLLGPDPRRPSVMRLHIGIPGNPRP